LVLAVALPGEQLGIGIPQGGNQGLGGRLIQVTLGQRIDVVGMDGGDDILEQTSLLIDGPVRGRLPAEQPASTDDGEHEDGYEAAPPRSSRRSYHGVLLPRNARRSAGCTPLGKGDLGYAYGWGVEQQVEGRSVGVGLLLGQCTRGFPGSEAKVESRQAEAETR